MTDVAPPDPAGPAAEVGRRTVLRWGLGVGALATVPPLLAACEPAAPLVGAAPPDAALRGRGFAGAPELELHQGGWCWFQRPRTTIDRSGRLWLGSTVGGTHTAEDGTLQLTAVDLAGLAVVERRTVGRTQQDDHTWPAVLTIGSGVQAAWSRHERVDYLEAGRYQVAVGTVPQRVRRPAALTPPGRGMAYASLHLVGGKLWLLYRGEQFSWNLLTSADGASWTAHGLVVKPGSTGQRPYLQAASDGTVLHIVVTDGNPYEYRGTSVYAGVVAADLTIRTSTGGAGTVVGSVGSRAPMPKQLTRLLAGASGGDLGEAGDTDRWLSDIQLVDRRPTGVLVTREPWPAGSTPVARFRHRYHWVRQRPTGWLVEPLAFAGSEICARQIDYAGLGAQDPTDPGRVVISTNVHPVTEVPLTSGADGRVHFELFEGLRGAAGGWTWTALTVDSSADNLRPVITAAGAHKALAWIRGTYWSWTDFDTALVVRRV